MSNPATARSKLASPRPARILLVDDNDANLLALEAVLDRPDRELVKARSGREAVTHALSGEFAVILLDIVMPEMDGFETARRIREQENGKATPIIFLTAYRDLEEQLLRGYGAGAVDFLYKPIEPDVLRFKVSVFTDLYLQRAVINQYAAKLEAVNSELESRVRERTADLVATNEEMRLFAYAASHDLKEPLRTISSYISLLGQRYANLNGEAAEFMDHIVDSANRMNSLLNDLLSYSEYVNKPPDGDARCDTGAVIQEVTSMHELLIRESEAVITYDPLPTVAADFNDVMQLFQNLIVNALKYRGPDPPRIHISAEDRDGGRRFSVRDNGIGIDPRYHDTIFGVFKRLHGRELSGNGIGLAICKKIVERYHGRIWVESAPERGAAFYFTLPAALDE